MKNYKFNAILVGILFITTMLSGMIDAYMVVPQLGSSLEKLINLSGQLYIGIFCVFFMAVGIVGIAIALFPVVKLQSEEIAVAYLSFRIIECFLLLVGSLIYIFLFVAGKMQGEQAFADGAFIHGLPRILSGLKYNAYQLAMLLLGIGSLFLCYSFFKSKVIPRWLSTWGFIGYFFLAISAPLDMLGIIDTANGAGGLMYAPGGIWEFIVFPLWLFIKGFNIRAEKI